MEGIRVCKRSKHSEASLTHKTMTQGAQGSKLMRNMDTICRIQVENKEGDVQKSQGLIFIID